MVPVAVPVAVTVFHTLPLYIIAIGPSILVNDSSARGHTIAAATYHLTAETKASHPYQN